MGGFLGQFVSWVIIRVILATKFRAGGRPSPILLISRQNNTKHHCHYFDGCFEMSLSQILRIVIRNANRCVRILDLRLVGRKRLVAASPHTPLFCKQKVSKKDLRESI